MILNGYGNMSAGRASTASGTHLWQKHLTNYCKRRLILPMPFLSYPHMTEIELNEKITNLLSENPTQQKQSRRPYARENRVKKDDRLLRIIQRYYIPHAGYVDCGFDSTTLLHSGKYIKYPKHSHCQRWMKRLTSKKTRRCTDLVRKGNEYRRLFDYWWTLY